jgi:hypothetical protein
VKCFEETLQSLPTRQVHIMKAVVVSTGVAETMIMWREEVVHHIIKGVRPVCSNVLFTLNRKENGERCHA